MAMQIVMLFFVMIISMISGIGTEEDAIAVSLVLSCIGSIILFYFMYRRSSRTFIIPEHSHSSGMVWIILLMLALNYFLTSGIGALQDLFGTDFPTSAFEEGVDDTNVLLLLLSICILTPIAEELCFRGLAFNYLRRTLKFWPANFIHAAVFALVHIIPIQIGYTFFVGLLFGWIYNRTGRLSTAIVAHIAFNSAIIPLAFIPGIEDLLDDAGRMFILIGLPSIAVFLGLFALFYFWTNKRAQKEPIFTLS